MEKDKSGTVEFKNIFIKFKDKEVLKDFSLEVKKGEKILISSPSGSGKTTLLRLLMGFEVPASGEIYVDGIQLNENSINNIRERIGYLSQKMTFRNLSVISLIKEILSYKSNNKIKFDFEKIEKILDFLNLETDILAKEISQLSGGEKQRIGFLVAVILDRDIWVFDEITSSLDMDLKEKVMDYIGDTNKTVIMITHDKVPALKKFKEVNL
ncbi:ABC transporter ATP-binding protein [Cetobacterium sp. SF1]|uniref:ABC transporter ATP-binding protein n=1 Tax=Cetobacterium sp. SF1 TaxID=3417654 RepID=UPI003CF45330